ncbi:type I restriction-modification system subunit M [Stecheria sp. CLA-KB-P133]|uniref:site-specific DNA-methyltransferase (adenine-specific) n=1 Tax=Grylomicrobium aquisgranensis TaxID=2926318 RepID=A0AB35U2X0_9FIRM|nr:type I restriction-modification system subunit M [Stecheria sp. CLA-KB-P133]
MSENKTDYYALETKIDEMIDELQGLCSQYGLSNTANEEVVVTSTFLYKFLNDKYMYNLHAFADELGESVDEVLKNENDELDAFYDAHPTDVVFHQEDTIEYLINRTGRKDFSTLFDDALERISNYPENDKFKVCTAGGEKEPLFTRITETIIDRDKRNTFAVSLFSTISEDKFDFSAAFGENFDFYSTIFEYLIKNYNVASGTYAEYFTPQSVSSIIGRILVGMSEVKDDKLYEVLDCAAGSGSLVLHLANELGHGQFGNRARVYCQDVSSKSTRFLRMNMMLNGLTESLDNIVQGDSLTSPAQYNANHDPSSGYKKFDYVTINPPFKTDFSSTRDEIENNWKETDRFFAGVPNITPKKKDKMPIYLCFIQDVLWRLNDTGRAAIVCPTGFLTAQSGIEIKIRQKLIDSNWLKGVVSMPSNIFANTGTNVSVLFIDKTKNDDDKVILIDASKLGEKRKEGKNQRTVLRNDEIEKIISTFNNREALEDFSVVVTTDQIKEKNYSFSAGQYFEVKIEYVELTEDEFNAKLKEYEKNLDKLFAEGDELQKEIQKDLKGLKYED